MHTPGPIRYALLANIYAIESREGPVPMFWSSFSDLNTTASDREHEFTNTVRGAMVFHNKWTAEFFRKHFMAQQGSEHLVYVTSIRLDAV